MCIILVFQKDEILPDGDEDEGTRNASLLLIFVLFNHIYIHSPVVPIQHKCTNCIIK